MYPFLKSVHFIALSLLVAAPAFLWLIWEPAARASNFDDGDRLARARRRVGRMAAASALLFALSGALDALRAASQIIPLDDFAFLQLFFLNTGFGRLTLVKLALAPAYLLSLALEARFFRWLFRPLTFLLALALVYTVSAASHAAGKAGSLPLISDMVHVVASSIWGGGLVYLAACAPRRGKVRSVYRFLHHTIERFSNMALMAVAAVVTTGAFATYLHVFDLNAARSTRYGQALIVKILLFLSVVGIAGYNLMVAGPSLSRHLRRFDMDGLQHVAARLGRLIKAEAAIVLCVLVAAGVVTTLPPADKPGTVIARVEEVSGPDGWARIAFWPLDRPGQVVLAIEAALPGGEPLPPGSRVVVELDMVTHSMGIPPIVAHEKAPGVFEAEALLPMAGRWRMVLHLEPPLRPPGRLSLEFDALTGSMLSGRVRRFEPALGLLTPVRQFTLGLGLILVVLGAYGVVAARRGRLHVRIIPLSLAMVAVGGYQALSVTLTDSIPTSFVPNPVPYTLEAVARGAEIFAQHCAMCHGVEGRGDGVLAASLNPPPADLTADHVDDHSDGDIFWWVTHGIEQTAMPAFGSVLTEEERWTVIHFVRSLRHFVPALEAPGEPAGRGLGEPSEVSR